MAVVGPVVCALVLAVTQAPPQAPTREAVLAAARDVMKQARYATFITLDAGQPQARIVDPFDPDDTMTVWIATNPASRKVGQIERDPRATLTYFHTGSASYVTLTGRAEIVRDKSENARRWKDEWAGLYKDKNRGDDYLLIRFTPDRLEISSDARGMRNDPKTWRPVTLDLKSGRSPAP